MAVSSFFGSSVRPKLRSWKVMHNHFQITFSADFRSVTALVDLLCLLRAHFRFAKTGLVPRLFHGEKKCSPRETGATTHACMRRAAFSRPLFVGNAVRAAGEEGAWLVASHT